MTVSTTGTVIPESVRYAGELYAGFFASPLIESTRSPEKYRDAGRELARALALGFAAELADTENVRTDENGRAYIIVNPMFSSTIRAAVFAAGLRTQDIPAAVRLVVTEETVTMSMDTFGMDRQYFPVFPRPAGE